MAEGASSQPLRLPCCVDAPEPYRRKAHYALRMLLLPLGIDPVWVRRADLTDTGVYYGTNTTALPPRVLALRLAPEAPSYFARKTPYDPAGIRWRNWSGEPWPVLFADPETDEDDLVASTFFWLSGWQEVTTRARDRHGRFPHRASLQAHLHTTTRPAVDAYRAHLAVALNHLGLPLRQRLWGAASWAVCPTHDIDYMSKWRKGMIYREVVPYLLRNQRDVSAGERVRRFGRFLRDWLTPEDVYRQAFVRLHQETKQRGGTATFFLKTGAHGPHDVFYDLQEPFLQERLSALLADGFEVGLHPSYFAHTHPEWMAEERRRLDALLPQAPISVRQHYLRYEWPTTLRLQRAAGFRIDTTLGFAEHEGFRHATCMPFQSYDPYADAPVDLWQMPLAVMESALFNRRHYTVEEAVRVTRALLQTCRRYGGVAVLLWHNILWDTLDHPGWDRHFIETLEAAVAGGAYIASLRSALEAWSGVPDLFMRNLER